jgi:cbb3-type cytochrome oxidase subunit 3
VNQVLREGAQMAQLGWLLGITTVVFFAAMVGWTVWAFSPSQRENMKKAAQLPLDGGAP